MKLNHAPRLSQVLIVVALLLVFAAQVVFASPINSAAFDEEYHLGAGYAYLKTGDPRLATEHPPLINAWNALPLLFLEPQLPLDQPAWINAVPDDFGDAFLWQANVDHAIPMVLLGRLPILFLGLLSGAVIFRWTRDLFGSSAALLALALFSFDPNLIAHARLSTTDLGLAFTLTLAMWRVWVWLEKPSRVNLIIVGVTAGMALTTKFTALTLAPLCLLAVLAHPSPGGMKGRVILQRLLHLFSAGLIALGVIWIVYGFEIRAGLPAATYWQGLIKIYTEYSQGYPTFLLGEVSRTGWWYYFPITFALKTPLPTLILFVIGLIVIVKQHLTRRTAAVIIPPLIFMSLTMLSPFNIGYRHILAVLPFVIVIAGQASTLAARAAQLPISNFQMLRRACSVVLIGWLILDTVTIYPHHLSYFNEFIGGMKNADRTLVDSNLDWGQDLPSLRAVMQQRGLDCVNLSYFGTALPAAYGIRYSPLPGFLHFVTGPEMDAFNPYTPEPGWYAISATSLRLGLLYRNTDLFQYFHDKPPIDHAGYSIGLYEVKYPPGTAVHRAVIMGVPTYSVPAHTLGLQPNTRVNVKWVDNADAFILAMNGPARYIADDPLSFDRALRKEFRTAGQPDGEALIVDARPIVQAHVSDWQSVSKPRLPDGAQLDWPIHFDNKLALIGYHIGSQATPGGEVDLITYWQVTGELNGCESLAYFAHVTTDVPQAIQGQYDGWNIAQRGLEVGDVIVQHARIPIQADTQPGTYQLRLGLYSPDTSQRLRVNGTSTDHVLLSPIEITAP